MMMMSFVFLVTGWVGGGGETKTKEKKKLIKKESLENQVFFPGGDLLPVALTTPYLSSAYPELPGRPNTFEAFFFGEGIVNFTSK